MSRDKRSSTAVKKSAHRSKRAVSVPASSQRPGAQLWDDFFARLRSIDVPEDFMVERPMNRIPEEKNIFGEDQDESPSR